MIERTHTPGPWQWVAQLPTNPAGWAMLIGPDPDSGWIAQGNDRTPDKPDGKLIAAAPDLLAALESMVDMFERHIDGREGPDDAADRWDAAQAAIDKATN